MTEATRLTVAGDAPYEVVVGHDLLADLGAMLGTGVRRVLVVSPKALRATADSVQRDLTALGLRASVAEVPDAEQAKTAEVATQLWQALGESDFTRSDAIVGLGGGAVTDLAGFVAGTWLRGVRVVHVPTTLLAMVDAAVGGKAGINTGQGKNLVGVFHPPAGVLCDLQLLKTLPQPEFVAGLAEVVKCGFIADPLILQRLEDCPAEAVRWDTAVTRELVERSVRVKAEVVGSDLRESSLREILNYGHTFGHAVELVENYTWRHGSAVSVGLVYAAELARLAGLLDAQVAERHRAVLLALGLPTSYRQDRWDQLATAMRRDKKTRGDLLRFVVLTGVGEPTRLEGPSTALLQAAYAQLG